MGEEPCDALEGRLARARVDLARATSDVTLLERHAEEARDVLERIARAPLRSTWLPPEAGLLLALAMGTLVGPDLTRPIVWPVLVMYLWAVLAAVASGSVDGELLRRAGMTIELIARLGSRAICVSDAIVDPGRPSDPPLPRSGGDEQAPYRSSSTARTARIRALRRELFALARAYAPLARRVDVLIRALAIARAELGAAARSVRSEDARARSSVFGLAVFACGVALGTWLGSEVGPRAIVACLLFAIATGAWAVRCSREAHARARRAALCAWMGAIVPRRA